MVTFEFNQSWCIRRCACKNMLLQKRRWGELTPWSDPVALSSRCIFCSVGNIKTPGKQEPQDHKIDPPNRILSRVCLFMYA